MKRGSTYFLQTIIVLIGLMSLFLLLRFPLYEGRNVNATIFEVYFQDPFLAYIYLSSVFVFVAYYQAFKLLAIIRSNTVFSVDGVKALRSIKYCAMALVGLLLGAELWLLFIVRLVEKDIAGGVMMGLVMIFITTVIAVAAGLFERMLEKATDFKSENDLTV